ncbi:arp2/3 complex 20 kD subunit, putative [Entamoeba dispar SAW760]|uniref:Actin-related protein 2/3 complex subunit 4 n=1 Tax=Entamoeba dispar (strain ATCC PRA-260 / SAW760) TaxID=370354 RepID=B0ERL6_ENTDS|nr:arp2/3 complex 20 kD subunit, putative [Entamoeba dispar SAW760]EDR22820.1 arp2/3 complex 20 kD subunit, putative [Entamoeba dispar SAW760]|eukprot:EDR22820.1 arp2/3 complex 20 kD subunit, putative [Entamoeba dispar SAW760]
MATTYQAYLDTIRATLNSAMCVTNFASQLIERHNKPEVELGLSKEVIFKPVVIVRVPSEPNAEENGVDKCEKVMIEGSINSVRISICVKKADNLEVILLRRFVSFLQQRAENFVILRRKPIKGYDISFLITNFQTENLFKHKLIDFIIEFMQEIDKEISDMKISVNTRARIAVAGITGIAPAPGFFKALLA